MKKIIILLILFIFLIGCDTDSKQKYIEFELRKTYIKANSVSAAVSESTITYFYKIIEFEANLINNNSTNIYIQKITLNRVKSSNINYNFNDNFFSEEKIQINSNKIKPISYWTEFGETITTKIINFEELDEYKEYDAFCTNATEAEIEITYLIDYNVYKETFVFPLNQNEDM